MPDAGIPVDAPIVAQPRERTQTVSPLQELNQRLSLCADPTILANSFRAIAGFKGSKREERGCMLDHEQFNQIYPPNDIPALPNTDGTDIRTLPYKPSEAWTGGLSDLQLKTANNFETNITVNRTLSGNRLIVTLRNNNNDSQQNVDLAFDNNPNAYEFIRRLTHYIAQAQDANPRFNQDAVLKAEWDKTLQEVINKLPEPEKKVVPAAVTQVKADTPRTPAYEAIEGYNNPIAAASLTVALAELKSAEWIDRTYEATLQALFVDKKQFQTALDDYAVSQQKYLFGTGNELELAGQKLDNTVEEILSAAGYPVYPKDDSKKQDAWRKLIRPTRLQAKMLYLASAALIRGHLIMANPQKRYNDIAFYFDEHTKDNLLSSLVFRADDNLNKFKPPQDATPNAARRIRTQFPKMLEEVKNLLPEQT